MGKPKEIGIDIHGEAFVKKLSEEKEARDLEKARLAKDMKAVLDVFGTSEETPMMYQKGFGENTTTVMINVRKTPIVPLVVNGIEFGAQIREIAEIVDHRIVPPFLSLQYFDVETGESFTGYRAQLYLDNVGTFVTNVHGNQASIEDLQQGRKVTQDMQTALSMQQQGSQASISS